MGDGLAEDGLGVEEGDWLALLSDLEAGAAEEAELDSSPALTACLGTIRRPKRLSSGHEAWARQSSEIATTKR